MQMGVFQQPANVSLQYYNFKLLYFVVKCQPFGSGFWPASAPFRLSGKGHIIMGKIPYREAKPFGRGFTLFDSPGTKG